MPMQQLLRSREFRAIAAIAWAAASLVLFRAATTEAPMRLETVHLLPTELRVSMSDSGPVLVLPAAMRRVLESYAPGYRPWRLEEYDPRVAAFARAPQRLALFGTIGDFNGDGIRDIALEGNEGDDLLFFAIVSDGNTFRLIEIEARQKRYRNLGEAKRLIYLRSVPPGPVEVPQSIAYMEGPAPVLEHDAFERIYEGQASVLYYWKAGRFVQYITGD